ncbi:MAG: hypothetical protein KBS59_00405 [Clostridiales bacterium]|nr:hypothetical protein [Clostridiales bacterium]
MDGDFSEILSKLLSDEQMMGKIRALAGEFSHSSEKPQPPPDHDGKRPPPPCPAPRNDCLGGYAAIISAMKPYLNGDKCARADKLIGMLKVMQTVKTVINVNFR